MDELLKSISKMIVNGNRLELPKDEQFANYAQVKKALITAGGKYKRCGFDFTEDAGTIKGRLLGGETINDKKKFQFFATPAPLAKKLVEMADVHMHHLCLEPSAGQGAISDLLMKKAVKCTTVEIMPENLKVLRRKGCMPIEGDFLKITASNFGKFDRIVANPPFTRNQDIDHIRHMFTMLSPGGKLVSMASKSWTFGSQKKQVAFRKWLDDVGATITDVPAGAFKESGTAVSSVIVEITS